jgi:hypothetical protein
MNEEEIQKALEIIKQPITVNCIDYHYFDTENYDKIVAVYDNCRWFINNVEQIIDNCNELKSRIDKAIEYCECHFKTMVADEEAEELLEILKGKSE